MARGDIVLHPEHGVNPTLTICFWCGKETGEIALLGNAYKGRAPHHMWLGSYEPCDECDKKMKPSDDRVLIIEAQPTPVRGNQPPMQENPSVYPTGRYVVLKAEAMHKAFNEEGCRIIKEAGNQCLLTPEVFREIFPDEAEAERGW